LNGEDHRSRKPEKNLQRFYCVKGANFYINRGELFGFLGPNGAGKTTTINMLTGLARISGGRVKLLGEDYTRNPKKAQAMMGIVPDESNLYEELNGWENLCFCGALYGMEKHDREKRAQKLLEQFGLEDAALKPFKAYSKGMKRKLTIAAGIIHEPEILFGRTDHRYRCRFRPPNSHPDPGPAPEGDHHFFNDPLYRRSGTAL